MNDKSIRLSLSEQVEIRHYVEFLHPEAFISSTSVKPIKKRDPKFVSFGKNVFGFRFFDRKAVFVEGDTLLGEIINKSGWYYQGEIMTVEDVKQKVPDNEILLKNMEYNHYDKVVKTKFGQFIPLEKDDEVVHA